MTLVRRQSPFSVPVMLCRATDRHSGGTVLRSHAASTGGA